MLFGDVTRQGKKRLRSSHIPRSLHFFKASIGRKLCCLNLKLVGDEHNKTVYSLHTDFSRTDRICRIAELLLNARIVCKLVGKDYDRADNFAPFLGEIMDGCCGTVENCPSDSSFTLYAVLVFKLLCRTLTAFRNEAEFGKLDKMIKMYNRQARQTFAKYQLSRVGASKYRLYNHIPGKIKPFESILYSSRGLHEYIYPHFKRGYKRTSKYSRNTTGETLAILDNKRKIEHCAIRFSRCTC